MAFNKVAKEARKKVKAAKKAEAEAEAAKSPEQKAYEDMQEKSVTEVQEMINDVMARAAAKGYILAPVIVPLNHGDLTTARADHLLMRLPWSTFVAMNEKVAADKAKDEAEEEAKKANEDEKNAENQAKPSGEGESSEG